MSWLAEILRKKHRECNRCGLGPTHMYGNGSSLLDTRGETVAESSATPLCNGCLAAALSETLTSFSARGVIFEPALGPDALVFHPLDSAQARSWPARWKTTARSLLDGIKGDCDDCTASARFVWIPVEHDANLWEEDWLPGVAGGALRPGAALCGGCAARRLCRSIEDRGLFFELVISPGGADCGDGVMFGCSAMLDSAA